MSKKIKIFLMLFPVLLLIVGIFVSGLAFGLLQSFGYFPIIGLSDFTFKYYKEILTDHNFISSFRFSLCTSFVSSLFATFIGLLLAYVLFRNTKKGFLESIIYKIPIVVPHTVAALIAYTMLTQSGFISRILYNIGLISDMTYFPSMIYDKHGISVIFAYMWKGIPFVAMISYDVLKKISSNLADAAHNLGANNSQVFRYILLPLIMPTLLSSFIIIFAFSFGAFEIPYLLGASYPRALPVNAFIHYSSIDLSHKPYAMVVNVIISGCTLLLVWLYIRAVRLITKLRIR